MGPPKSGLTRRPAWWFPPVGTVAFWVTGFAWVASLEDPPWQERVAFVAFAVLVTWRFWLPMGVADRVAGMSEEAVEAPPQEVLSDAAPPAPTEMPDGIYVRKHGQFRLAISDQIQQQLVLAAQAGHMPQGVVAQTVLTSVAEASQALSQAAAVEVPQEKPADE